MPTGKTFDKLARVSVFGLTLKFPLIYKEDSENHPTLARWKIGSAINPEKRGRSTGFGLNQRT
jgi:hypothetical protein